MLELSSDPLNAVVFPVVVYLNVFLISDAAAPPPPPEDAKVIVSPPALVVRVMLLPATRVRVSVALSATTSD